MYKSSTSSPQSYNRELPTTSKQESKSFLVWGFIGLSKIDMHSSFCCTTKFAVYLGGERGTAEAPNLTSESKSTFNPVAAQVGSINNFRI